MSTVKFVPVASSPTNDRCTVSFVADSMSGTFMVVAPKRDADHLKGTSNKVTI